MTVPEGDTSEVSTSGAAGVGRLVESLIERGTTVATCESLTGGLLAATLTSVPGSSAVVRGGLITYATDLKSSLAGVDPAVVAADGVVSEAVARAMAEGVRSRLGADLGLACTGVAGPGAQDGLAAGTVWIAVAARSGTIARRLAESGDRQRVREATVAALIALTAESLKA
ncbi:CinA family protein [Aestuariimicrobium sp. T2.26MG-19.2B]|uniref:CinA family protein n=1 Tax=Aestuariimicrobium sp. T2.26MG-19.2B TaxID=3040679 RepID=UPI0024773424|nr:CinA family protein [Aestuariimicrobium sp. T2.26MG-19.2B]CAI9408430.1 Protein MG115 [Aestuariimicrobium sp. T2.26MG-19.2B]